MPREKRKISKTKIYHIMMRSLNKQLLFDDENDYLKFLEIFKDVKNNFGFQVYAYCLMDNHIHILLKDVKNNLSNSMNRLCQRYAIYFNKKNNRTGYVFNDRYHSEVVENENYFFACIRYIHQNPIKALICDKTYKYKFSSIHSYRKKNGNYLDLVDVNLIKKNVDIAEFLKWNELTNNDMCMDVIGKNNSDKEVLNKLLAISKTNTKAKFDELSDAEKVVYILKLLDLRIPIIQISRVTGLSYGKIQRLKKGVDGKVKSLTYYK